MKKKLKRGKDIILFYKKHKWDYVGVYSKRSISGFYAWYTLLVEALKVNNFNVHENDYELASFNPDYPIGIVGTPDCLVEWSLPNPAILGPSMYDNPKQNLTLMQDPRFKYYLLTCGWLRDVFYKVYGDACVIWHAGISLETWPDVSNFNKTVDVLIYDKIRWSRDKTVPLFVDPIVKYIKSKNLSYAVLQYGDITHQEYKDLLKRSKVMVFLCEHETQGIAYQEALASNVPVLAWDHGWWTDPVWPAFSDRPIPATSVPFFSKQCGEKFKMISDFPRIFDKFWSKRNVYQPRAYVKKDLSFKRSADLYAKYYFSI